MADLVDPADAFLEALYTAIAFDEALGALLATGRGVSLNAPFPAYLDEAPPDEPFPYVVWNVASDTPWHDSDGLGSELLVDIHVFTQGLGSEPCRAMRRRIRTICTDPAWVLTGAKLVLCRPNGGHVERDEDGFHGVVSLRALVAGITP